MRSTGVVSLLEGNLSYSRNGNSTWSAFTRGDNGREGVHEADVFAEDSAVEVDVVAETGGDGEGSEGG